MPRCFRLLHASGLFFIGVVNACFAGDWPQILGPDRNGIAVDETLADVWPKSGPRTVWQRDVGSGFAGPSVMGGTLVLFHRVGDEERVEAMNASSGETLWTKGFPTDFSSSYSDDNGPRCVPLIHKDRVYVYGAQGGLRCLDLGTGDVRWSRETHKDYSAPEGYFGAGSTPIIEGDLILVNVGGARSGAGVVAFSLEDGKTVWKAIDETASYSSPAAATIDGTRHVIFVTRLKTVSLDPKTGRVRFEFPFGMRGPTVNAATPLILGDHLFVTAHYGVGAVFAKIGKNAADIQWQSDDVMSCHYMTCVEHDGALYGIHGQERVNTPELRCFDPKTQKIHWTKREFGYGSLTEADGKLVALTTTGELVLLEPGTRQYRELARARLFHDTTRALPALANGSLFARDTGTLKCVDLGPQK